MAEAATAVTGAAPSGRRSETAAPARRDGRDGSPGRNSADGSREPVPEFPGCRPVHVSRDAIANYEGRIETWDAATETAMVCEPTSTYHEHPSQRLAQLTALIAVTRGAPIATVGTADLLLRDERGERRRILQADQTVYLHPERDGPAGPWMVVGEDVLPDVVLEVDHTTDARRGKLALYESFGLREVWIDVPDAPAPSRPATRAPGLTIHVLGPDSYRTSEESRAFPGWTAVEIHRAMHEPALSAETVAVLERVGRTLRDREGRPAGDGPFLRRLRGEIRAEERAQARAEERARLCRQAALRFEVGTGERLGTLIVTVDEPAFLAAVADWIVVCATGADLLDRVRRGRPAD